jgi:citrate synthase
MAVRFKADGVPAARRERRKSDEWRTALTCIERNKILVRGYPVDELMGRLTFGEAIYLLFMGEIPSPGIGSLMEAVLVSFIDHGVTPPSTLAARNVATTGAGMRACVAGGLLGFGRYHGGDIEQCMQFLNTGLDRVRGGASYREAAGLLLAGLQDDETPPGFGHRFHTRDPRAARLFQMALELELEAENIQMIRAVEMVLHEAPGEGPPPPVNIDGAIAAVCGDIGIPPSVANALFLISRVPGIAAHAEEERIRQNPMRQIDPKDHTYDGPSERRLPDRRK